MWKPELTGTVFSIYSGILKEILAFLINLDPRQLSSWLTI